jgi:hypothetical protein
LYVVVCVSTDFPHRFRPITTEEYFEEKNKKIESGAPSAGATKVWKSILPTAHPNNSTASTSIPSEQSLFPESENSTITGSDNSCGKHGSETGLSTLTVDSMYSTEAAIDTYENRLWHLAQEGYGGGEGKVGGGK